MTAPAPTAGDLTDPGTDAVVRTLRAAGSAYCSRSRMEPTRREMLREALVAEARRTWSTEASVLPFAPTASYARTSRAAGRDARVLQPASA